MLTRTVISFRALLAAGVVALAAIAPVGVAAAHGYPGHGGGIAGDLNVGGGPRSLARHGKGQPVPARHFEILVST